MYNDYLSERLHEKGATLVGFADLTLLPNDIRKDYKYGVSIAIALNSQIVSRIPSGPHLEYYEEYKNVSDKLNDLCEYTATLITDKGYNAFPQSRRFIKQDKNWRTQLPHKTVATLAGIGWIGKSALLVTEKYGSAIRITSVLTDMPVYTETPITISKCGDCMICTSLCPGKAVNSCNWYVGIDRDELLDPKACKSNVVKRGEPFNLTEGTCGVCISVCPYTQKYLSRMKTKGIIEIIQAQLSHAEDIGFIHAMSWQAAYKGVVPDEFLAGFTPEKRADVFKKVMPTRPEKYYIIYIDEKPAGLIVFGKTLDEDGSEVTADIGAIYFLPEYWGKGYGKYTMDFALNNLRKSGYKTVTIWVLEENYRARWFYEKCGFILDGAKKEINLGKPLIEVRYRKEISCN